MLLLHAFVIMRIKEGMVTVQCHSIFASLCVVCLALRDPQHSGTHASSGPGKCLSKRFVAKDAEVAGVGRLACDASLAHTHTHIHTHKGR